MSLKSNYTALNNDDDYPVVLRFSKSTGEVNHIFLCEEGVEDCSTPYVTTFFLQHLQFDKPVHVIDDTTVCSKGHGQHSN